jgi:hypothetical protein
MAERGRREPESVSSAKEHTSATKLPRASKRRGRSSIGVHSEFLQDISGIPHASVNLILGMGYDGPKVVLLPFLEFKLAGNSEKGGVPPYSAFVHFDNASFVLQSLATYLSIACKELAQLAEGPVQPEITSITDALKYLGSAESKIRSCRETLEAAQRKFGKDAGEARRRQTKTKRQEM